MRGAHRDIWCSKNTPLIEAELFAVESCRPAPSGRALLCAAPYARKIQGSSATYKRKDARNRAPVTPVSRRDQRESRRKGGFWGSQEGAREPYGALAPFAPAGGHRHLRRQTAAFPPVNTGTPGRRRRPLSTLTSSVKSPPAEAIPSADGIEIKSPCSLGELQGPILFRGSSTHTLLRREGKNRSSNRKQLMNLCPPLAYDATRFGRK